MNPSAPTPPGSWRTAVRGVRRILAPVERFLAIEAASGIVLMLAATAALVWANSPWRDAYEHLWHTPVGLRFGDFSFVRELHFVINEGLMTVFFFLVGLEIRREIHGGELSEARRAALPLAAAVGGMLAPAVIFLALNAGRSSQSGWAIPMATDIAFAVGALTLLGKRVAPALRVLLLALAVIDDVGAILVIAVFYSSEVAWAGFVALLIGLLAIRVMNVFGVRASLAYMVPGLLVWAGAYWGGIHPTLAGVIVGMMTPVVAWYGAETFMSETEEQVRSLRSDEGASSHELLRRIDTVQTAGREAVSPVERLQHQLHGWVAFGIMPLFAFANAGVPIGQVSFAGDALWVFIGVVCGLALGKPIGILALSWLAARLNLATLPRGVKWPHVGVVGMVGGIGFTMALFIAELAFPPGELLDTAKLAILCGSALAAGFALVAGRWTLSVGAGAARTDVEAECSTQE